MNPSAGQDDPAGAVEKAIGWLAERHRKGFKVALDELLDDWRPDNIARATEHLGRGVEESLQINLTEWLLAEGTMLVKREPRRIVDHLLGRDGPSFTPGQQRWLRQLSERPLRLYSVTDVRPGEGMTLCDALEPEALPVQVDERAGSSTMKPGMLLGCRVMALGERHVMSGALYVFSKLAGPQVLDELRAEQTAAAGLKLHPQNVQTLLSRGIGKAWLRQFVEPPRLPQFIDASTGEPLLLITDHYRVDDWAALAAALAGCADVHGSRADGWHRDEVGADGLTRSRVAINLGRGADRIELFYRTQALADAGRPWFDTLAGAAVGYLTRELSDPAGVLAKTPATGRGAPKAPGLPPGMSPEAIGDAIEQVLRRSYAGWADEPIPALDHRTPRQAIATPAGLERVKGLLRSYEDSEPRNAAAQGRRTISYQFLWDALGLDRTDRA